MTTESPKTTIKKEKRKLAVRPLTEKQKAVLGYLHSFHKQNGFWPSIREILKHFDFKSTNAVQRHIQALEKKGCIKRSPGHARAFFVYDNGLFPLPKKEAAPINQLEDGDIPAGTYPVVDIPIYGSIAAGYPDRVESAGAIGRLQIDAHTAGIQRKGMPSKTFALKVKGDSMVDAGIFEGDLVVIEPGEEPVDGAIVAALIDGETTLKRLVIRPGEAPYLKAENKKYPELYPIAELLVQGVARSIVRSL